MFATIYTAMWNFTQTAPVLQFLNNYCRPFKADLTNIFSPTNYQKKILPKSALKHDIQYLKISIEQNANSGLKKILFLPTYTLEIRW